MNKPSCEKKVLLFFTQNPYPGKTGTHKRCLTIISALQQLGCHVTFFSHAEYGPYKWDQDSHRFFEEKDVTVVLYKSNEADEVFSANAHAKNPNHLNLAYHCPPGLVAQFKNVYNSVKPDIVFIFYAYSSGLLSAIDPSICLTIMDSIDLVSLSSMLQHRLSALLGPPPYNPLQVNSAVVDEDFFKQFSLEANADEFSLYDLYDYTLVVSQHEASEIAKNTRKTKVEYLPITFSVPARRNNYAGDPVFVAADNLFNVQAYMYLACRIVPILVQINSQFQLKVVGEITKNLVPIRGMDFKGFVPDLRELYESACCAVCPIIGGTGMSVKVIEAMAHGVPVVVLRNNTQESLVRHGVDGFIANNAEEFACYLMLLYNDRELCARMGAAAREAVVQNFSDNVVVQKLGNIFAMHQKKSSILLKYDRKPNIRVLYDISVLGLSVAHVTARTGIFRVVEHVAQGLAKSPHIDLSFCSTQSFMEDAPYTADACRQYLALHPEFSHIPFFGADIPEADIFHSPFHGIPDVVTTPIRFLTVYDLIPVLLPQFVPQHSVQLQSRMLRMLKPQDRCICISEATKNDLCRFTGLSPERAYVSHLAADPGIFYPFTDIQRQVEIRQKYNIGTVPYILCLCTLEPRKNIDHVLRAFARLVREGRAGNTRLVLTGTKGWDFDRIFNEIDNNPELHKRIVLAGYVPDEELAALYSGAMVFVYMSLYEGFGLPPLEAMQCGVPVITSNTSSLPEVVGDAGIMLDPQDLEGLCRALQEVVVNPELHTEMSKRSLVQAANFSWDRCVEETIAAYKNAIHDQKGKPCTVGEPAIVIDGVIFQLQHGRPFGISRMWWSLLTELAGTSLAGRIVLLDREGTAPEILGTRRRRMSAFRMGNALNEVAALDQICREEEASLFISTYYTFTTATPSLLMLYDMIPERFDMVGLDAPNPEWRDKYHAISNSPAFSAISQSTARDLATFYPQAAQRPLMVAPCAVSDNFRVHSEEEIVAFKAANGIDRPYFLLVGRRDPHKNAALFFRSFAQLPDRERYAIVMAGGGNVLEPELRELAGPAAGYAGFFSDQDLSLAYSGAIALVYPSLYEGFGLPILEAMQSGCPVITCQNSSLPEVAGSAALYVGEYDVEAMTQALLAVQQPDVRGYLIKRGLERARLFSWQKSAELLVDAIQKTVVASGEKPMSGGK